MQPETRAAPARPANAAGVLRAEDISPDELMKLCAELSQPSYSHEQMFGEQCFLAEHIQVPYNAVFDYCADPLSLCEWTLNIRHLRRLRGDLFAGKMVFSREDAANPNTDIYIRADVLKGPEHGSICYPCAWDQRDALWMRYYFTFADARITLGRPGTVVLWVNCKHSYYDRATPDVPEAIQQGRQREDRPWAGDGWPLFYPLHRIELLNLKKVLEHRYPATPSIPPASGLVSSARRNVGRHR